jgi:hypothetical protein
MLFITVVSAIELLNLLAKETSGLNIQALKLTFSTEAAHETHKDNLDNFLYVYENC